MTPLKPTAVLNYAAAMLVLVLASVQPALAVGGPPIGAGPMQGCARSGPCGPFWVGPLPIISGSTSTTTLAIARNSVLPPGGQNAGGTNLANSKAATANPEALVNAIVPGGPESATPGLTVVRVFRTDLTSLMAADEGRGHLKAAYAHGHDIKISQSKGKSNGADIVVIDLPNNQNAVLQQNADGQFVNGFDLTADEIAALRASGAMPGGKAL